MKRTDPQFKLRLDSDLKKWLEEQAQSNLRSVTSEIVYRLQRSREAERSNVIGIGGPSV